MKILKVYGIIELWDRDCSPIRIVPSYPSHNITTGALLGGALIKMEKKYDYLFVKNFIEKESNSGCKLITTEYKNSNQKLLIKCKCGEEFLRSFSNFYRGHYYCRKCRYKNSGEKHKLTHEEFIKRAYSIYGNEYTVLSTYTKMKNKITVRHNKCGYMYEVSANNFLNNKRKCPNCYAKKRKTTEEFKEEVRNLVGEEYSVIGEYVSARKKLLMHHYKCGRDFEITPDAFLRGERCPVCANNQKKTTKEFQEEINKLTHGEYMVLGEYVNARTPILIKHNKCNTEWMCIPYSFLDGVRCPKCKNSRAENKVYNWLKENNINFKWQYVIKECKHQRSLRFDFAIFDDNNNLKCLIEVDGKQHFEPVMFGGISYDEAYKEYNKNRKRDKIKEQYCRKNKIKLIRVPYTEIKEIDKILKEVI